MQVRYDEEKGIYRDCKFCHGRGCLACPGEAEKEYRRQFPDGPQPIATIQIDPDNPAAAANAVRDLIQKFSVEEKHDGPTAAGGIEGLLKAMRVEI